MSYETLLSKFYKELELIQKNGFNHLKEANLMSTLCAQTISKMKKVVVTTSFENKTTEIHFFKNIKTVPMQYLIYNTEVRSCELQMPKIGKKQQLKFLDKQIAKVNHFFGKHTEFLIYIEQEYSHFDKLYFTRKHVNHLSAIKSYPYYKDPLFNTSHDGILVDRAVKVSHLWRTKVSIANHLLKIDSI